MSHKNPIITLRLTLAPLLAAMLISSCADGGVADPDQHIVFGHWASLGLVMGPKLIALDSGCAWGRQLSAVRLDDPQDKPEHWQVDCS